jgi:hypothetical protein
MLLCRCNCNFWNIWYLALHAVPRLGSKHVIRTSAAFRNSFALFTNAAHAGVSAAGDDAEYAAAAHSAEQFDDIVTERDSGSIHVRDYFVSQDFHSATVALKSRLTHTHPSSSRGSENSCRRIGARSRLWPAHGRNHAHRHKRRARCRARNARRRLHLRIERSSTIER